MVLKIWLRKTRKYVWMHERKTKSTTYRHGKGSCCLANFGLQGKLQRRETRIARQRWRRWRCYWWWTWWSNAIDDIVVTIIGSTVWLVVGFCRGMRCTIGILGSLGHGCQHFVRCCHYIIRRRRMCRTVVPNKHGCRRDTTGRAGLLVNE